MAKLDFSDSNFEQEVLKSDQVVLVDFFASWCAPCKMQTPIIEELAEEFAGRAKLGAMDIDANPKTAQKFGVMSIPTLIIFKSGQPVETLVGVQSKDILKEKIQAHF